MPTMNRRRTLPLDKDDSKQVLDLFVSQGSPKTLPTQPNGNASTNVETTAVEVTVKDSVKRVPKVKFSEPLKRNDSYKRANYRQSVYEELPWALTKSEGFNTDSYDSRKYKTLPKDMGSLQRPKKNNKRPKVEKNETAYNNNDICDCASDLETEDEARRGRGKYYRENSGTVPSPDTDDEEASQVKRKKKSAFQKAKDRILQTFRKKEDQQKEKRSKKEKKKRKTRKISKHVGSSIDDAVVLDIDQEGHTRVAESSFSFRRDETVSIRGQGADTTADLKRHTEKRTRYIEISDDQHKAKSPSVQRFKSFRDSLKRRFSNASKYKDERRSYKKNSNEAEHPAENGNTNPPKKLPHQQLSPTDETAKDVFEAFISQTERPSNPEGFVYDGNRGDRSKLHLQGLVPCYTDSLTDQVEDIHLSSNGRADITYTVHRSVHFRYSDDLEIDGVDSPKFDGFDYIDGVSTGDQSFDDVDGPAGTGFDDVDGPVSSAKHSGASKSNGEESSKSPVKSGSQRSSLKRSPIPFNQLTKEEQNKRIQSVANRLAYIADQYVAKAESSSDLESPKGAAGVPGRLTSLEMDLIAQLRKEGDRLSDVLHMPESVMSIAMELAKEASYNKFKKIMQSTTGGAVGWNELAMTMYVTKAAVHMAGKGGNAAIKIKDAAFKYFQDTFSPWLSDKGGWDSVLEDTDIELD